VGVLGCWSGGGGEPAAVIQELGQVVDGAEELDFGAGGVAAVEEIAAEPGEELGEGGLDEPGAAPVELLTGRGGEPGGHFLPAEWDGGVRPARPVWGASAWTATSSRWFRAAKLAAEA